MGNRIPILTRPELDAFHTALHKAAMLHDSATGEANNDMVEILETALDQLNKVGGIGDLATALVKGEIGAIPEFRCLHQYAFTKLKAELQERDSFFLDNTTSTIIYIPKGWVDQFHEGVEHEVPETRGYRSVDDDQNSDVDAMWIPLEDIELLERVSREVARQIHPRLFQQLGL